MFGELNSSRRCRLFHTRCQDHRVPDGFVVHAQVVADRADNHWPRVNAYTELDAYAACTLHSGTYACHRLLQGQGRPHRPLGSLLYGQWCTEKRHQAIARELVHRAFIAVHLVDEEFVQLIHEGKQPFLTHLCAQSSVTYQVSEQYRHQLALTRQSPTICQDFVGQVRREVALQVIELVVKRGQVARRSGWPCNALGRGKRRRQALTTGAAEPCPRPVRAVAGRAARF
jgi:hypothetical protein